MKFQSSLFRSFFHQENSPVVREKGKPVGIYVLDRSQYKDALITPKSTPNVSVYQERYFSLQSAMEIRGCCYLPDNLWKHMQCECKS